MSSHVSNHQSQGGFIQDTKKNYLFRHLKHFLETFDLGWNWQLILKENGRICLKPQEPYFLLEKLSQKMTSAEDQSFCTTLIWESVLTFSGCSTHHRENIQIEESHQMKWSSDQYIFPVATCASYIQCLGQLVGKILHSWKQQFLIVQFFLSTLVRFLDARSLNCAVLDCGLAGLTLLIGKVELQCQVMPRNIWERPLVTVQFPGVSNKFLIRTANFRSTVNLVLAYVEDKLEKVIPAPPLHSQEREVACSALSSYLEGNKLWSVTTSSDQWKITPVDTFRPLEKITNLLRHSIPKYQALCSMSHLESRLVLNLMPQSQCSVLYDEHWLMVQTKPIDKQLWVYKGTDEKLFPWVRELLESWTPQFALIHSFFTHLAEFLQTRHLHLMLKSTSSILQNLALQVEGTELDCCLIPPHQQRPVIRVDINKFSSYQVTDKMNMASFFDSITSLLLPKCPMNRKMFFPVKEKKRKLSKLEEAEEEESTQSLPMNASMALMQKLRSGLVMNDMAIINDFSKEKANLQEKVDEWRKNGNDVLFEVQAYANCYKVVVGLMGEKLEVEFKELKSKVAWTLRLGLEDLDPLSQFTIQSSGISGNFYQILIDCLMHFLEQQLENHIVVEVKVEPKKEEENNGADPDLLDFMNVKEESFNDM